MKKKIFLNTYLMKKHVLKSSILSFLTILGSSCVYADNIIENDYHTDSWDTFSYNYDFSSGANYTYDIGKATTTDKAVYPTVTNERVNKDSAYTPPSYGIFSGEFDTSRTNPYFDESNFSSATAYDVTNYSTTIYTNTENNNGTGGFASNFGEVLNSSSLGSGSTSLAGYSTSMNDGTSMNTNYGSSTTSSGTGSNTSASGTTSSGSNVTISYVDSNSSIHTSTNTQNTPLYYEDGSIGTIYFADLGKTLRVWEGETLTNLDKGAAHFEDTAFWNGNVGLAGHNDNEFKNIWNLANGSIISYTTQYGSRNYQIVDVEIIANTDFSTLEYTSDNRLTLITCVNGQANNRYSVTATEV